MGDRAGVRFKAIIRLLSRPASSLHTGNLVTAPYSGSGGLGEEGWGCSGVLLVGDVTEGDQLRVLILRYLLILPC